MAVPCGSLVKMMLPQNQEMLSLFLYLNGPAASPAQLFTFVAVLTQLQPTIGD